MTYEYAQKVMKAAGVEPSDSVCACGHCMAGHIYDGGTLGGHGVVAGCSYCECAKWDRRDIYSDPLTSGDAFIALWDALVTKDFLVRAIAWNTSAGEKSTFICIEGENWRADSDNEDIKAALVEVAGQALGVSR